MVIIGAKCTRAQNKAIRRYFYLMDFSLFIQLVEKGVSPGTSNSAPMQCEKRARAHHSSAIGVPEHRKTHHRTTTQAPKLSRHTWKHQLQSNKPSLWL
jgi:hypothetical protein